MPSYLELVYNGGYIARYGWLEYWRWGNDLFFADPAHDFIYGPVTSEKIFSND